MRNILSALLINCVAACGGVLPNFLTAQESWTLRWQKPIDATAVWDADPAGNVYLFNQSAISKLDTSGKQLLTQSTKSLGDITKIDAGNWLKVAVFSEGQQQICYLDNALAIQPGCIELSDLDMELVQQFSTSIQTDRIWVYDQPNSELKLITLRTNQQQVVQNLKALMDIGTVVQLFEFQNTLYLADDQGLLVQFDNFGTLLSSRKFAPGPVQAIENGILILADNMIFCRFHVSEKVKLMFSAKEITEPILHFFYSGQRVYVSTATTLYCFGLPKPQ